ncbi:NnrU family protein [Collimonas fungivorans]|uniref:NnrU family protein n=1 Tax=Collimonas fungivorans TaxID=158899 RepID=UPI0002FC3753|nr:NnrU family protein [Collimonas fungivorans]
MEILSLGLLLFLGLHLIPVVPPLKVQLVHAFGENRYKGLFALLSALGLVIWSLVHLLANGHAKATLLFAAFLAYAVIDLFSVIQRKSYKPFTPALKFDVIACVSGLLLAVPAMTFHRQLMGVAVVPWGA